MHFSVDLEIFRGPLDLLLYLVRKHEVEIVDIPIGMITDQFLEHLEVLEQIDVNAVGDFLEMATTLIEIKSRIVLPRADEEQSELEDPRGDLVRQLLEYKKFRDAASLLEEQSRDWQQKFARQSTDLPPRTRDLAAEPIHEVELWDLVSAFSRILRDSAAQQPSSIVYDDTPIHVYMKQILGKLVPQERMSLSELFQKGMHKSQLIGIFLAVLELVRFQHVLCEQNDLFDEMWLLATDSTTADIDTSNADNYEHSKPAAADGESQS